MNVFLNVLGMLCFVTNLIAVSLNVEPVPDWNRIVLHGGFCVWGLFVCVQGWVSR